jgi:plastocyanin
MASKRPPLLHLVILTLAAGGAASCSDPSSGPPPNRAVTPVDAATAGTIRVRVTYKGTVPEPKVINMGGSPPCAELHPDPVKDNSLLVSDGKLAGAVVSIKSGLGDRAFAIPEQPVIIDQKGCLYDPRVSAAMIWQPVEFHNSDREPHNVRGRPQNVEAWNFIISRQGASRTLKFDKPETGIRVGCDIHPWMAAYLSVFEHPYFGVTSNDGTVTLATVPPGSYVVSAWHEKLGEKEQRVELAASGSAEVEIDYTESDLPH